MANENSSQKVNNANRVNVAAVLSVAIISFFILIPFVSTISIPFTEGHAGVISYANAININPYTEYIKFSILLLVPLLTAIVALNTNQELVNRYWIAIVGTAKRTFGFIRDERLFIILILFLTFSWSVNRNYIPLDFILNDTFHEGEYLGFLPNFLTLEKPFLSSFMIHGFGMDVLTSLIANNLASHSNGIALTRFFRMTEGMIAYLGFFWVIWELVASNKFNKISRQEVFLLLSILFTILDGFFFRFRVGVLAGRDTLFILQLALTLRFFRISSVKSLHRKAEKIILPTLIGITVPASILYVYDRAVYFFLVYLLACGLAVSLGKKVSRIWLIGSIAGFAVSAIAIVTVLGFDQVIEISSQMSYWVRHGKYITFFPPPPLSGLIRPPSLSRDSILFWRYFGFVCLIHIFSLIYLIVDYSKNRKSGQFWENNCSVLILLLASFLYMRILLDRKFDAATGTLIAAFLLIFLCLKVFKLSVEPQVDQVLSNSLIKGWTVLTLAVIVLIHPVLNPFLLPDKIERLYKSYRTPDIAIERRDFRDVYRVLKPEVDQLSCFFTLSSEGFWYYLFDKPSCTKFSISTYAKTADAQREIVDEIDNKKPNIVLFNSGIDAIGLIPIADSSPIVYQYFLNNYRPYALIDGRWFWQRNDQKLTFAENNQTYGNINTIDVIKVVDNIARPKPIVSQQKKVGHVFSKADLNRGDDTIDFIKVVDNIARPKPIVGKRKKVGNVISKEDLNRGDRVWLNGISPLFNQANGIDAVYVSYGEDNQLISATWVEQDLRWRVRIPTISLPARSDGLLRVWGYDAKNNQLVQVGHDIKIDSSGPV